MRARQGPGRVPLQGVPGEGDLRAREERATAGVRGLDLRAREAAKTCKECGGSGICEHGGCEARARSAGARASASTGRGEAGARVRGREYLRARGQRTQCKCGLEHLEHGSATSEACRAARDASPALSPVHPKPEILVELEDVEDPGGGRRGYLASVEAASRRRMIRGVSRNSPPIASSSFVRHPARAGSFGPSPSPPPTPANPANPPLPGPIAALPPPPSPASRVPSRRPSARAPACTVFTAPAAGS